jgi:L-alanine-DL-glutamate epimerase-like enolase superfamily enzyme
MIITAVEALPLRIPFKAATRSAAAVWGPRGLNVVDSLLVKVTTDDGLEGWGESFGFTEVPVVQRSIEEVIAPLCVGQPRRPRFTGFWAEAAPIWRATQA